MRLEYIPEPHFSQCILFFETSYYFMFLKCSFIDNVWFYYFVLIEIVRVQAAASGTAIGNCRSGADKVILCFAISSSPFKGCVGYNASTTSGWAWLVSGPFSIVKIFARRQPSELFRRRRIGLSGQIVTGKPKTCIQLS